MVRDFSEQAKQKMLGLIDEIENENEDFWSDLVGDLWNYFQTWIGLLNIKRYADNIPAYHRKVFDMRNTSKAKIDNIFTDVANVDSQYQTNLSNITKVLGYWKDYVSNLNDVMISGNGGFNTSFNRLAFSSILKDITSVNLDDHEVVTGDEVLDRILSVIKAGSKAGAKLIEKLSKNDNQTVSNKLGLAGSIISFLTGLHAYTTNEYKDGWDFTSGILGIIKNTGDANSAVYKFISKSKGYYESSIYEGANQGKMGVVSLIASVCGFSKETINTIKVFSDPNTEGYIKFNQVLTNISSSFGVGQSAVSLKYGIKTYEAVKGKGLTWTTPKANAKVLNNASAAVTIATMYIDALKGGIEKHHEVTQDGELSMVDMADIGMAFALKGLASEINSVSFGLTDALFDLSGHTDDIQRGIKKMVPSITDFYYNQPVSRLYMEKGSAFKEYADNQNNDIGSRIVASVFGGVGMLGAMTIDNLALVNGGWMISGWDYINSTFINK